MIHLGIELKISQVLNVLEACVLEIERNKKCLTEPDPKDGSDQSVFVSIMFFTLKKSFFNTIKISNVFYRKKLNQIC